MDNLCRFTPCTHAFKGLFNRMILHDSSIFRHLFIVMRMQYYHKGHIHNIWYGQGPVQCKYLSLEFLCIHFFCITR